MGNCTTTLTHVVLSYSGTADGCASHSTRPHSHIRLGGSETRRSNASLADTTGGPVRRCPNFGDAEALQQPPAGENQLGPPLIPRARRIEAGMAATRRAAPFSLSSSI